MRFGVFAVSRKAPDWIAAACDEYVKRMPRELPVSIVEIKPAAGESRAQRLAAEKVRFLSASRAFERVITLDERGADLTTLELARRLESWCQTGGDTAFAIGSAEGLDEELKRNADESIRLSSLTLPHTIARLLLCEQLYRAASLLKNHPYHRK
ncbi:MAG: 23S rRNA (pseudouridine(1915)-N(3))-methyltransferase RlmH [Candidatus Accumulibacter sp.]|jgi:23S rRNA (pseudouridine1915-N3)-methyltransferase|nr:23S rRNA (pseudouridine(1915)-N(3))-methyltransferase RlmH [Accumulibacter sp.]